MVPSLKALLAATVVAGSIRLLAAGPVVAILEYPQCAKTAGRSVRVLFAKSGQAWRALDSQETWDGLDIAAREWTVAFDGRDLGRIHTTDSGFNNPEAWTWRRDRLLDVRKGDSLPQVGNVGGRFEGWCGPPPSRPLVLLSGGKSVDPDGWKPIRTAAAFRDTLLPAFKKAVGAATTCGRNDKVIPFRITVADLVVERAYRSVAGKRIVIAHLDPKKNTCDGIPSDEWLTHTFVIGASTTHLGPDFDLVDAGDYDADGRTELLFWYSGYDQDGYTLFYDDFRHHVDYRWNYH